MAFSLSDHSVVHRFHRFHHHRAICRTLQQNRVHKYQRSARTPLIRVVAAELGTSRELKARPQFPAGSFGWPLVGESLLWLKDFPSFFAERHAKHGMVFKTHVFGAKTAVVSDPMQICRILQGEDKLAEIAMPDTFKSLLPNSLLSVKEEDHRQARRMLTSAYAESSMRQYHPVMVDVVRSTLQQIMQEGTVQGYTMCRALAFDVAASVLLGIRWDSNTLNKLRREFTVFIQGAFSLFNFEFPGSKFQRAKQAQESINEVVADVVADVRKQLAEATPSQDSAKRRRQRTVLQLMLEARDEDGQPLSEKALQDQVIVQMFAGHETTAAIMTNMLQRIKANPGVLQCMREEQQDLIRQHGQELTADVVESMPYTDAVIKECLRLHNPAATLFRRALEDIIVDDNLVIPKGWSIQLNLFQAQKNVQAFEADAEQFRPERWLDANNKLHRREPAGYAPWGAGPRKCMGMPLATAELRVFLAVLAREYDWECDPNERWISAENLRPEKWLMTKLTARSS